MARWAVALAVSALFGGLVLGCGPSLRRSQQSRVYFERCYAADFDTRIAVAEKHACWTAWLEHYTIGQPEDRRDYAQERIYAIEHGESVPRLPGLPEVALGPRTAMPVTAASIPAEEPTEEPAETPPVDRVEMPRHRHSRRDRMPPLPRTANPACAAVACEPAWRTCIDACPEDSRACETACELELSACARGCF